MYLPKENVLPNTDVFMQNQFNCKQYTVQYSGWYSTGQKESNSFEVFQNWWCASAEKCVLK